MILEWQPHGKINILNYLLRLTWKNAGRIILHKHGNLRSQIVLQPHLESSMAISRKRLKTLLDYDPDTGLLRWKAISCTKNYITKIGDIAGSKTVKGYLLIMIDGVRYQAHRLIWFMIHGKWPKRLLDHRNGVKYDNRLINLRQASDSQNKANGAAYKGSLLWIEGGLL